MSNSHKPFVIQSIEVRLVGLPMIHPFTTSFGTIKDKATVLAHVTTADGVEGWGEGSALPFPFYKPETTDTAMLALSRYIAPLVVGKTLQHPSDVLGLYAGVKGYTFAKTALETALWMLYSEMEGASISSLLGGEATSIPVGESIGIHPTMKEELEEISIRIDEGYRRIKVKIKPGFDVNVVSAIREKFGDIDLMVDGNSAYSLKDMNTLKALDEFNLTMIEQPLADDDIIDHATLQKQIKTPVCLDESILSAEDARKAIEIGACKIINIKPGRVGGLTESKKIHDLCAEKGVGVWCGGMLETGIGRAYNIAVSSLPNYIYPADMSPNNIFYEEDLINPTYEVKNGYVQVPGQPGLGFSIVTKRIEKYTVDKVVIS